MYENEFKDFCRDNIRDYEARATAARAIMDEKGVGLAEADPQLYATIIATLYYFCIVNNLAPEEVGSRIF